jgi:glycosyltransferase involved in cell wall biosynthesis
LKRKILWLASWYPNKHEPLSGDFIERHAKAASLLNDVTVIHVVKDHAGITSAEKTIVKQHYPGYPSLQAITCYYTSAGGLFSFIKYFSLQRHLIKEYIREHGKPDLINVHISFKAGVGALYAKWRHGIKYLVSEQWTIFCPEAKPSFADQPQIARNLIGKIYRGAITSSAVSNYLSQSLADKFGISDPVRIPNVVDTSLFFPSAQKHDVFTFIHISVLNYQKSPEEILEAVCLLKTKTGRPFQLIVYGPHISIIEQKIKENHLNGIVQYRQEVMQDELSAEMRKCHSLLLYSRFETFGCVVIEALASGLPVVVSDIPVMHELVQENVNGTFARIDDPEQLASKMLWMMENHESFDQNKIANEAKEKYAFASVARQFNTLYSGS